MTDTDRSVTAYLDDLARMLAGADPVLRAEVLGGVREHIDAALADGPGGGTPARVDAVLLELGPPERIAAAALGDDPSSPGRAPAPPRPAALDRSWVPPVVGLLLLFTAGIYLLVLGALAMFTVTETVVSSEVAVVTESGPPLTDQAGFHAPSAEDFAAEESSPLLPPSYDAVWRVLAPLPLVALLWLLATVLLAASSLWTARQKWFGVLLLPGMVVLSALALTIALAVPAGVVRSVLLAVVVLLAAVAVVRVVARIWSDGARRARELSSRVA